MKRKYPPDFNQLVKVFKRQKTDRPVLFEYFMNGDLFSHVLGRNFSELANNKDRIHMIIDFFYTMGYDYATIPARYLTSMVFGSEESSKKDSISLNAGNLITNSQSFLDYKWPNPETGNYGLLDECAGYLPDGMKFIVPGPGGLLENVIYLVGFENLCFMLLEEEDLARQIFDKTGKLLLRYYEICSTFGSVGALIVNDDWGFKTQTMFDSLKSAGLRLNDFSQGVTPILMPSNL
jgi:uroporphyrinogen decarboxylase